MRSCGFTFLRPVGSPFSPRPGSCPSPASPSACSRLPTSACRCTQSASTCRACCERIRACSASHAHVRTTHFQRLEWRSMIDSERPSRRATSRRLRFWGGVSRYRTKPANEVPGSRGCGSQSCTASPLSATSGIGSSWAMARLDGDEYAMFHARILALGPRRCTPIIRSAN